MEKTVRICGDLRFQKEGSQIEATGYYCLPTLVQIGHMGVENLQSHLHLLSIGGLKVNMD